MAMTKKDFIELADTMRDFFATNAGKEMDDISKGVLLRHICQFCKSQNSNFKQDRFVGYIYGENGPSGGKR